MADAVPRRTGSKGRGPAYDRREKTAERGYGGAYQRARVLKLAARPLCEVCESRGSTTPAVQTHHVEPTARRIELAAHVSNLVSVCERCHIEIEGLGWRELGERYKIEPTQLSEGW